MLKKFILLSIVLLFVFSCGDDDPATNDARFIGRWEGLPSTGFACTTCTATEYEQLFFVPGFGGMLELTNDSTKGTYVALNGTFTPTDTHDYSYNADNWVTSTSTNSEGSSYTFIGTGVGSVVMISNASEIRYMTNAAPYVANANFNGTWSNYSVNSGTTNVMIMEINNGVNFTMTEKRSTSAYTAVTKEITTGTASFSDSTVASMSTPGWMETRILTRREWVSEGGALGAQISVFDVSRLTFAITNSGANLVANGAMLFLKIN